MNLPLPKDPTMLMSFVNTQLRDKFGSLTELAKSYGIDEKDILKTLEKGGFKYDDVANKIIKLVKK